MTMTMLMKGLPLAYNKDLQEDKEPVFDAIDTVKDTLRAFIEMMAGVEPNREEMRKALLAGYPTATDLADYLPHRPRHRRPCGAPCRRTRLRHRRSAP
jgi:argininosuccinate lyase